MSKSESFTFPTLEGSFSGEVNIYSPPNRFLNHFIRDNNNVSVGELRFIIITDSINLEKRTVIVHITGNEISKCYKMVKATLTTIPRGNMKPTHVAWTVEFEKISLDIQDPVQIRGTLTNLIEKIDQNLYQQDNSFNSMYVESTAVECFKAIIEAFKDDADVDIKDKNSGKMTTTMSLRSTHVLMKKKYNMIKVTITVTPQHDDDGSLVEWTLEIEDDGFTNHDCPNIHEMIKNKLRK